MDESDALLLLAALGVGYVVLKDSHAFGFDVPAGDIGPGGITGPARTDSHGNSLAGEIGAAACIGGGTAIGAYYGQPAAGAKIGAALAPVCSAVAPYVAKGAKFIGKEAAAGATFIAHYTAEGARDVGKAGAAAASFAAKQISSSITNPGTTFIKTNVAIANAVNSGTALVDREVNSLYAKSPTAVKLAIAPIVGAVKVSAKIVSVGTKVGDAGAAVASKVTGTLESGAKSAGHAIASGASTVLGWLS
jgi:hypothetical protein